MCGSAPSVKPPKTPSPMEEAQAQMALERERAMLAETARQRELTEAEAARARELSEFNSNVNNAVAGAQNYARSYATSRGINFDDFSDRILGGIGDTVRGIPLRHSNPGSYLDNAAIESIFGRIRDSERIKWRDQWDRRFGGNRAANDFGDSADDHILDAILGEQLAPAQDMILRARQRGNLTDTGYASANNALNSQISGARSKLQSLGGGVLAKNRFDLDAILNDAFNKANNYELGQRIDFDDYEGRYNAKKTDLSSRFEGDIRNAIMGENLFDTAGLISRGGIAQGTNNPSTFLAAEGAEAPIVSAFKKRQAEDKKQRGLGEGGVF